MKKKMSWAEQLRPDLGRDWRQEGPELSGLQLRPSAPRPLPWASEALGQRSFKTLTSIENISTLLECSWLRSGCGGSTSNIFRNGNS